jgi:hypothetical protein
MVRSTSYTNQPYTLTKLHQRTAHHITHGGNSTKEEMAFLLQQQA